MNVDLKLDRPTIVVGATLSLLLILVLYWILYFWFMRAEYVDSIEAIAPRTARLIGMEQSYEEIKKASGIAQNRLTDVAYSGDRDTLATASDMQRNVRDVLASAGVSVTGSHILPTIRGDGFEQLTLDVTVEGSIDAVEDAFLNLEGMRPAVFVKLVKLKPTRNRGRRGRDAAKAAEESGDPRVLSAQFQLISLRLSS